MTAKEISTVYREDIQASIQGRKRYIRRMEHSLRVGDNVQGEANANLRISLLNSEIDGLTVALKTVNGGRKIIEAAYERYLDGNE